MASHAYVFEQSVKVADETVGRDQGGLRPEMMLFKRNQKKLALSIRIDIYNFQFPFYNHQHMISRTYGGACHSFTGPPYIFGSDMFRSGHLKQVSRVYIAGGRHEFHL